MSKKGYNLRLVNFGCRWVWWLLVGVTTAWLLWMTLRPDRHFNPNQINLIPMAEHSEALICLIYHTCFSARRSLWFLLIDVVGNVAVFIPLGFGLAGALPQADFRQNIGRAALGGFSLSLVIELSQLAIPSRTTDVDDLIFNTIGATLGAVIFVLLLQTTGNKLIRRKATGDS
jgi:glycopeptide antibiotics resistance protein